MASKADLESREAACNSVDDYVALALEALADPADTQYAKELLGKAEMECQMPLDYIKAADVAAGQLGDKTYAADLYEQAEDMLFELQEFTAFSHSMSRYMEDQDKAREYLEKAADEANQLPEFLSIAKIAREDLQDEALSQSLLAKVEEQAKGFKDYRDLAKTVKKDGDEQTARGFYKKAARFCDDIPATVDYAQDIINIFDDKDWARQALDEAEIDCQFTKEFVQLAQGYKDMFDDMDKVNELMDQAAEFCMTGEEHVDLARGYWTLLADKEKAAESYQQALSEITDKQQLLDLAKTVASELENPELAKTMYAKAESRMSSASDLSKLAQAVVRDLKDKEYAAQIYTRAAESLVNPNDLMNLAGDIVSQLEDRPRATTVYRKAFERAGEHKQLLNLVQHVDDKLQDKDFAREVLAKAEKSSQQSPVLVEIAERILSVLDDKEMATRVLETAEEGVTSIGELRAVTQAVKRHFGDDAEWVSRIDEKLAKREANQATYNAFQQRENAAESLLDYLHLAEAVMEQLEDKFYARKLLVSAEQAYQAQGHDFNQGRELIIAIGKHLADQDWIKRLLDDATERCHNFAALHAVGETAATSLSDKAAGKALARTYYQAWEQKLDAADVKGSYDYTKLAKVVAEELGDNTWSLKLIDKAEKLGGDHFAHAQMGLIAAAAGNDEKARTLYKKASEVCDNPTKTQQLVRRLKSYGVDGEFLRELYAAAKPSRGAAQQRQRWVEGIVETIGDKEWAAREYDEIASELTAENELALLQASRRSRLKIGLW